MGEKLSAARYPCARKHPTVITKLLLLRPIKIHTHRCSFVLLNISSIFLSILFLLFSFFSLGEFAPSNGFKYEFQSDFIKKIVRFFCSNSSSCEKTFIGSTIQHKLVNCCCSNDFLSQFTEGNQKNEIQSKKYETLDHDSSTIPIYANDEYECIFIRFELLIFAFMSRQRLMMARIFIEEFTSQINGECCEA